MLIKNQKQTAFTIVELLVVIVVIGILAAITVVSFAGIRNRAIVASLESDLTNAATQLELYKIENELYPASVTDCPSPTSENVCIGVGNGNEVSSYVVDNSSNPPTYKLVISNDSAEVAYSITESSGVTEAVASWKYISAGYDHTCAIANNDQIYCWGQDWAHQIGNPAVENSESLVPMAVYNSGALSGKTIKSVVNGNYSSCAIASDDLAYCWGWNYFGQLGNGSTDDATTPTSIDMSGVLSGKTIKSISVGQYHACAIASDNLAYCWGQSWEGELGNGSRNASLTPTAVDTSGVLSGKTIKSISVGQDHTCAIASDDLLYCWGGNIRGELGNNLYDEALSPIAVDTSGVLSGKTIKAVKSSYNYTCAIASDNRAYCWGENGDGQLGDNSTQDRDSPVAVYTSGALSGLNIEIISTMEDFTCALATNGQAYCWGVGSYGQLGNNSTDDSITPVGVYMAGLLNGKTIQQISAGGDHACVIASDNQIYCWGYGFNLGHNSYDDSSVPVSIIKP